MLKNGEGGGWWPGEDSLDLIGIRDALWQAANTARGAQDKANGELMPSGKEKGKKRKGKERGKDGEIGNQLCSQGPAKTKPPSARQAPARFVDTTGRWELHRYLGPVSGTWYFWIGCYTMLI
jgi:hypothetical protein